uniref:Uncharacterized protein n=1 Tax=Pseudomonas fluorescens (strain SBW25) TaxID=216595 RepID=A0A0G4E572_PSEFS|nr:hypothetical protein [Pseudomonas fluorescens]CEK42097.1 hypothetical protein PQBR57_0144 [Pseudomonas fluorescens SBW25]
MSQKVEQVADPADIPFGPADILFIDTADEPSQEIITRISRFQYKAKAFCFIGSPPVGANELAMTGHRVYELPASTVLVNGLRALKPHDSSIGVRWLEVVIGQTDIQPN